MSLFSRKKAPEPPMEKLLEVYNEIASTSLNNLSLEQNNRSNEALNGWKSLTISIREKIEALDKSLIGVQMTDEEIYIFDEIKILEAQSLDHLNRLDHKLYGPSNSLPSDTYDLQTPPQTATKPQTSSSLSVPTMRTPNPTPMSKKKVTQRPLVKTLRKGPGPSPSYSHSLPASSPSSSSSSLSKTKLSAKHAANISWDEPHRVWSPSTSLAAPNGKSYSSGDDAFGDFDNDLTEYQKDSIRQETLRQLQNSGLLTRKSRKAHSDEELTALTNSLTLQPSTSPQKNQATYRKPTKSPVSRAMTSADRSRAALQKSAAVKIPSSNARNARSPAAPKRPSATSSSTSSSRHLSPTGATKSSSSKSTGQKSTNSKPRSALSPGNNGRDELSEKDTETLESENNMEDDEIIIASCKGVDMAAGKQILNEIVVHGDEVHWDDIAGLESAKNSLKEAVVYPFLRPDLFSGLREPARGMLLFGPPGTGKTMLARAVATESKSTFFSISASSLTSKYLGESEKLVRALFQLAKALAPSIIFVDEIDSLLGSRNNEGENESSRRIKNEFLVQWSDLTKAAAGRDQGEDLQRVLVLAATNLPWAIDEAARRRFVRRQYIPLPEYETRKAQFVKLLFYQNHTLTEEDVEKLIDLTEDFSGSDITALAKDAAMGPLRELGDKLLLTAKSDIRPVQLKDFVNSLNYIRPSVSKEGLREFEEWAKLYGSSGA